MLNASPSAKTSPEHALHAPFEDCDGDVSPVPREREHRSKRNPAACRASAAERPLRSCCWSASRHGWTLGAELMSLSQNGATNSNSLPPIATDWQRLGHQSAWLDAGDRADGVEMFFLW